MSVKIFVLIDDVDRMMLVTALLALHGAMTFTEHCAPFASSPSRVETAWVPVPLQGVDFSLSLSLSLFLSLSQLEKKMSCRMCQHDKSQSSPPIFS